MTTCGAPSSTPPRPPPPGQIAEDGAPPPHHERVRTGADHERAFAGHVRSRKKRPKRMQTSNVYRVFAAKSKINDAVCLNLLAGSRLRNDTCSTSGFASSKGEGEYARRPALYQ